MQFLLGGFLKFLFATLMVLCVLIFVKAEIGFLERNSPGNSSQCFGVEYSDFIIWEEF